MLIIVCLLGIVVFVFNVDIEKVDQVFFWVFNNYVGDGLKGFIFVVFVVVIGLLISLMVNSVFIIFILDIYKKYINEDVLEMCLVMVGCILVVVVLVVGVLIVLVLGSLGQVF